MIDKAAVVISEWPASTRPAQVRSSDVVLALRQAVSNAVCARHACENAHWISSIRLCSVFTRLCTARRLDAAPAALSRHCQAIRLCRLSQIIRLGATAARSPPLTRRAHATTQAPHCALLLQRVWPAGQCSKVFMYSEYLKNYITLCLASSVG